MAALIDHLQQQPHVQRCSLHIGVRLGGDVGTGIGRGDDSWRDALLLVVGDRHEGIDQPQAEHRVGEVLGPLVPIAVVNDVTQQRVGSDILTECHRLTEQPGHFDVWTTVEDAVGFFQDGDLEHIQSSVGDVSIDPQFVPGCQTLDEDAWYQALVTIQERLE